MDHSNDFLLLFTLKSHPCSEKGHGGWLFKGSQYKHSIESLCRSSPQKKKHNLVFSSIAQFCYINLYFPGKPHQRLCMGDVYSSKETIFFILFLSFWAETPSAIKKIKLLALKMLHLLHIIYRYLQCASVSAFRNTSDTWLSADSRLINTQLGLFRALHSKGRQIMVVSDGRLGDCYLILFIQ